MNKKLDFKGHQKYPKTLKQICIKSVSVTRKEEKSQLHQKRVIKVYFLIKVLYVPGLNLNITFFGYEFLLYVQNLSSLAVELYHIRQGLFQLGKF